MFLNLETSLNPVLFFSDFDDDDDLENDFEDEDQPVEDSTRVSASPCQSGRVKQVLEQFL